MELLSDVLKTVVAFPELYLGKPSLERLYAFIGGYLWDNEAANDCNMDGFNKYIANRYGIKSNHNWSEIIQFYSIDEQHAFDSFIKHFNDFSVQSGNLHLVLRRKTGDGLQGQGDIS